MNGYVILDFKGTDCNNSGSGATVAGVFDRIKDAKKPIMITGLVNGTALLKDFFAGFYVSSSDYVTAIPGGDIITIDDDDKCVISTPGA